MNTRPSELKRLIESRGVRKKWLAGKIGCRPEHISHALDPESDRAQTPRILKIREQIYQLLSAINISELKN